VESRTDAARPVELGRKKTTAWTNATIKFRAARFDILVLGFLAAYDGAMCRYRVIVIPLLAVSAACTVFDAELPPMSDPMDDCTTNLECSDLFTRLDDASAPVPAVCARPVGRCARLLSEDCTRVTGDYTNDRSIVIGSLFSTKAVGLSATLAIQREDSVALAVEELNVAGGIPTTSRALRPLLAVGCDDSIDLVRAGTHLVADLHVPAIVGPTTSSGTISLTQQVTAAGGAVLITPTAGAASVADLADDGLTFQMIPTDGQRGPLLIKQIGDLEARLDADGKDPVTNPVKLAIVFRNDALGVGTRASLNSLSLNGKPITDPFNAANVRIDAVAPNATDLASLAMAYLSPAPPKTPFLPDIVVLAGANEVGLFISPLESMWPVAGARPRPTYIAIDSAIGPNLTAPAIANDPLRLRIQGTRISSTAESAAVLSAFNLDYQSRYPGKSTTTSGLSSTYDATYAIGFALAATIDQPVTGKSVAAGLRRLTSGPNKIAVGPTKILAAFQHLTAGETVDAVGSFTPLRWNQDGSILGGVIEVWCLAKLNDMPVVQSIQPTPETYDLGTQLFSGSYMPCP
jgi:ABC-type branched-subunit amino acid transport system substrate-binding protein